VLAEKRRTKDLFSKKRFIWINTDQRRIYYNKIEDKDESITKYIHIDNIVFGGVRLGKNRFKVVFTTRVEDSSGAEEDWKYEFSNQKIAEDFMKVITLLQRENS
jgi:hypothetical protein